MALQTRDKRALAILAGAAGLFAVLQLDLFQPSGGGGGAAPSGDGIEALEQRLALAQARAERQPLAEAELASAQRSLERAEERLLEAADPALAQAEMRTLVGELLEAEGVPLQNSSFGRVARESEQYVRVPLVVEFTCGVDQLVNFLASVANQPRLLATRLVRIQPDKPEIKSLRVRLAIAGFLPLERAPELAERPIETEARL